MTGNQPYATFTELGVLLLDLNNCLYQCCIKKTALMFQYQNNISFFFTCKDQTSDQSHFVSTLRGVHHGDTSVQFEKFMFNHWTLGVSVTHNREIKIHVYAKCQTADVNLYHVSKLSPYFPYTLYCFYTKISSFMPVLTIGIVWDCFYLLICCSEKFSTWVWQLTFAVNMNLNLSNVPFSTHWLIK